MDIKLTLTIDEVNTVLNALACRPYSEVAELIGKIQTEGNRQLEKTPKKEE